jgi:protein involved in polysaccharide export with SLBB domain
LLRDYDAGSIARFFSGDHWRNLWITPIKVPILDIHKFAGGLTPFASTNNILVIRGTNGDTTTFKVRYKDIVSGNKPDKNIILKPGDIIMIN